MNVALIFAAGVGSRMRMETPKQYINLGGKPILIRTLEFFNKNAKIDEIYLVVSNDWQEKAKELINEYHITKTKSVVAGGGSALESIYNGLKCLHSDGVDINDVVLIHDGVRPIIDNDIINNGIEMAETFGNSVCSYPATETIAMTEDGIISNITDRSKTRILQAPQTFHFGDIYDAYKMADEEGAFNKYVDSAQIALAYGARIYCFDGIKDNIKLTTTHDLMYFQYLLKNRAV